MVIINIITNNKEITQPNVNTLLPLPIFTNLLSQNSTSMHCIVGELINQTSLIVTA